MQDDEFADGLTDGGHVSFDLAFVFRLGDAAGIEETVIMFSQLPVGPVE